MIIKNFTPHVVRYNAPDKSVVEFVPEGLARVTSLTEQLGGYGLDGHIDKTGQIIVKFVRQTFGEVTGLPDAVDGVYLIVSRMVASAVTERTDLIVPADVIRDEAGNITGCRAFERV